MFRVDVGVWHYPSPLDTRYLFGRKVDGHLFGSAELISSRSSCTVAQIMDKKILFLTREVEFSAAHRLYREDWTETENYDVFGKCANPYGHGHNYLLEVTFRGAAHPQTNLMIHFSLLKSRLEEIIVTPLDHRHLNYDVPFLKGTLPTSENLVVAFWDRISENIRGENFSLFRLKLSSSSRNWVEYLGPDA
jgi:6-pyruvoyltetrahydropterin/6-carboxytetrahydropterin synthase